MDAKLVLALGLFLSLVACSHDDAPAADTPPPSEPSIQDARLHCTQEFVDEYLQTKMGLQDWLHYGTQAHEEAAVRHCRNLRHLRVEACQVECSELDSTSAAALCPDMQGRAWSGKSTLENCKKFEDLGQHGHHD